MRYLWNFEAEPNISRTKATRAARPRSVTTDL